MLLHPVSAFHAKSTARKNRPVTIDALANNVKAVQTGSPVSTHSPIGLRPYYPVLFVLVPPNPFSIYSAIPESGTPPVDPIEYRPDTWENPRPLSALLNPDLDKVHFRQGTIGNCYLLAGVDAAIHHPQGQSLLDGITVEECRTPRGKILKYKLTFPSGRWGAFYADELGTYKCGESPLDGPEAIRMIELAYAKMTRKYRNLGRQVPFENEGRGLTPVIASGGHAKRALQDIFGGTTLEISARHLTPSKQVFESTKPLKQIPDGVTQLETRLRDITTDPDHIYLLSAYTPREMPFASMIYTHSSPKGSHETHSKRFSRSHSYSIRSVDLDKKTITIANPHDTKRYLDTLSFAEFCEAFQGINGIRLPKPTANDPDDETKPV